MGKPRLNKKQEQRIGEMYVSEYRPDGTHYTQEDLASLFDCCVNVIRKCLNKAKVDCVKRKGVNSRKLTDKDIQEIIQLYETPLPNSAWMGSVEIGRKYGVDALTIRSHLHKAGIQIRTQSEAITGKACKPITRLPPEGEQPPLCKCGCGQPVKWFQKKNRWYTYVKGHYRPRKPYHDKDWLEREYSQKKRTTTDIASQFSVHHGTIRNFLRKFDISIRSQAESLTLSGAVRGSNNPAWKGGVADWEYSYDWKATCKRIKDRDNWTCQLCGEQRTRWNNNLHVHHIDEDKINNHPHNLISLCYKCHHPIHGNDEMRDTLGKIAEHNSN